MYSYFTSALMIFLTHPGVVYDFFGPGLMGGVFQAFVLTILQLPSDGKQSTSLAFEIIYWVVFAVWAYIKVRLALTTR